MAFTNWAARVAGSGLSRTSSASEAKGWRVALQNLSRVLKGWQEEASDAGKDERRGTRRLYARPVRALVATVTGALVELRELPDPEPERI